MASHSLRLSSAVLLQREQAAEAVAYLVTEVLRGDAEDIQAHGGLLELGLQDLQLKVLLLAALPQLLDQRSVQLLGPVSLVDRAPTHCTGKYSIKKIHKIHLESSAVWFIAVEGHDEINSTSRN